MKGETMMINGGHWVVVDVAPAAALADMVANILEEENFVVMTRGSEALADDVLAALGADSLGPTLVLVPAEQAEAALALIAETVTDYEGDELEALLRDMPEEFFSDEADAAEADDVP